MNRKWLAIIIILIITLAVVFVFILPFLPTNSMSVQFYDDEGNPVGLPITALPLSPFTKDGVEVASFTITVAWDTTNPDISYIEWEVLLDVYYYKDDIIGADNQVILFTGLLWAGSGSMSGDKTKTSGQFLISTYAADVPEGQGFFMVFNGDVDFFTGNPEHLTEVLITTVAFQPASTVLYREAYTYTATLNVGW